MKSIDCAAWPTSHAETSTRDEEDLLNCSLADGTYLQRPDRPGPCAITHQRHDASSPDGLRRYGVPRVYCTNIGDDDEGEGFNFPEFLSFWRLASWPHGPMPV